MLLKSTAIVAVTCIAGSVALTSFAALFADVPPLDFESLSSTGLGGLGVWLVGLAWAAFRKWTKLVDAQMGYYQHEDTHRERERTHWRDVESGLQAIRRSAA